MGTILATRAGLQESIAMGGGREFEYLCVDNFLRDAVSARALASALELGIVDHLVPKQWCALPELAASARLDQRGLDLLAGMLRTNGVIEQRDGAIGLTRGFRDALKFRDLLEAKLAFAAVVAPDFLDLFSTLLCDPGGFFDKAKLFELFSYDRCFDSTPENCASTERWMRFTTALTRYESGACLASHDFSRYERMLDVGGNSGEFALRVCRRQPKLRATVYDLPLVCDIGERHVSAEPEAARIDFIRVDPAADALPQGYDLVTFKSMLHDWPDEPMQRFLARAHAALPAGGTVLLFERSLVEIGAEQLPYGQIPIMLFFRSYRAGEAYVRALDRAGFRDVELKMVDLDMPFMLLTAKK
jgi:hypothetical protein